MREILLVGAVDGVVGRLGHQLGLTNHERLVTANPDRAGRLGLRTGACAVGVIMPGPCTGSPPTPVTQLLRELGSQRVGVLVRVHGSLVLLFDITWRILRTHVRYSFVPPHRVKSPVTECFKTGLK